MSEHACRRVRGLRVELSTPMEPPEEPMNRYINPMAHSAYPATPCQDTCLARQNHLLLEQAVEHTARQNQLLLDLLGAVNALTAALLTAKAQV